MRNYIQRYSSPLIVFFLLLVSIFPLVTAFNYPSYLNDDAYITLTYSKNLANGNGFIYNHPPSVLGTTSPLFTIVVAGISFILHQSNLQMVAVFLTAFCWLGIVWIFYLFRKEWGLKDWQTCIVGAVVIGSGWIGSLGMESYPFAFLLVFSLSLFFGGRYFLTGLFIGLLFLTRGEGILVLGVILMTVIIFQLRKRILLDAGFVRTCLMILIGFAIPLMVWALYAYFNFSTFLPNTLAAKQAQLENGLWLPFWQRLKDQWIPLWGTAFTFEGLPAINFWWLIILTGVASAVVEKRNWFIYAGWIAFYISGYILLNVAGYGWYQLPILFVLHLFFSLGLIKLIDLLKIYIKPFSLSLGLSVLLGGILIFILARPTVNTMLTYPGDARGASYTALAQWFRDNTKSTESIAYIEIGYLGYFTDNRIIDLAGLTLPDIVPHIANKDFAWGFWHYQPDYYVYLPDFDWALGSIKSDPRFGEQYKPVATLAGPREANFVIYQHIRQ